MVLSELLRNIAIAIDCVELYVDGDRSFDPKNTLNSIRIILTTVHTRQVPVPEPKQCYAIKKMVLNNFKSYFSKIEIGPFHKSFSAIVGPNGSEKSNVIDALLF
ncbi:10789_t:CDS:2, partial [Funneliformis geosporum]